MRNFVFGDDDRLGFRNFLDNLRLYSEWITPTGRPSWKSRRAGEPEAGGGRVCSGLAGMAGKPSRQEAIPENVDRTEPYPLYPSSLALAKAVSASVVRLTY